MVQSGKGKRRAGLQAWLYRCEEILLSLLFVLTLVIAFGQIISRNLLSTTFVWADPLVRVLVLWIGMLGAMIATREDKHIGIDLISRYLSPTVRAKVNGVVSLFAGGVCFVAGVYSLSFVITEYQAGEIAFANVPAWLCMSILPAVFLIMALRFLLQSAMVVLGRSKAGPP